MINSIKQFFRKHGWLELLLAVMALAGGITRLRTLYEGMYVINHGLPQEFREGVTVKLAAEFAKGNNPYSIAYNELHVPVINHYGWFTGFFLSIFIRIAKLFTIARPQIICTLVTLGVIAIGCLAMWMAAYVYSNNLFIATIASELALSCYWRFSLNGGCFPDTYGLTLSFILMWLVEADIKRQKYRYPLYILIVILMFYTKQYFILCGVGVLIWLVIHDWKVACKYTVYGLLSGIVSAVLVNIWLPLYFTEALLYSGLTNTSDHNVEYARMQFQDIFNWYKPIFIVIICCAIVGIYAIKSINADNLKKLAWIARYDVIMAVLGGFACVRLGQHTGALYSYYLQIWMPYVISFSLVCATQIMKRTKEDIQYASVLVMLVLLVTPKACDAFYSAVCVDRREMQNWEMMYASLDEHYCGEDSRILVGNPLSFYAIEHDYEAYDYGSNQYVYYGLLDTANPLVIKFFPRADWLIEQVENTREDARQKIENGYFSFLAITQGNPCELTTEYIEETGMYELEYEIDLQTGNQMWHTYVYGVKD